MRELIGWYSDWVNLYNTGLLEFEDDLKIIVCSAYEQLIKKIKEDVNDRMIDFT